MENEKKKKGVIRTFLGVEEEEGLVECECVIIGRGRMMFMLRHQLDYHDRQTNHKERNQDSINGPFQGF